MGRKIKVATVSMALECRKINSFKENLSYVEKTIEEIAPINPDIIALPEVFPFSGIELEKRFYNEEAIILMEKLSRKYNTYIAGSTYDKRGEKLFNTAFLFNREGKLVGKYDKIYPTEDEIEWGIMPGRKDQLPLKTEFGKIGFQICFDVNWYGEWERIVKEGAEMIIFSSAFPGGNLLNSIALLNQVFIVPTTRTLSSGIIDNTGRWVIKTDRFSWWVYATINLERTVFHWDFQGDKVKEIIKKYGDKVKIETFGDEALFTIEPLVDEISIKDIIKEFNLVTFREYIKRATEFQNKYREK